MDVADHGVRELMIHLGMLVDAPLCFQAAVHPLDVLLGNEGDLLVAQLRFDVVLDVAAVDEIANAAALALKNLLGLACDPVAGLVEVPCVKRNVMGAVNAMTSADMTMAGIFSKIPPDEVIDAMRSIGRSMNEDIRETGKGGLAGTPTGVEIRDRMAGTL